MRDIDASEFGAHGKSTPAAWVDETAALQAALNAAAESGATLHLRPRGMYVISSPLVVDGAYVRIDGHRASIVTTNASQLAVLALKGGADVQCLSVRFIASGTASYALHCAGAGGSRFEDCTFEGARVDGVHLAAEGVAGGNDCMRFERCQFTRNGQVHDFAVTIAGRVAHSEEGYFSTWGTRAGDFINVGQQWLQVEEVLSEKDVRLALHPPPIPVVDPAPARLRIGDGYREESFNDNNLVTLRDCLFRANKGSGARFAGLFGARVSNAQSDFNGGFAFSVGMVGQVTKQTSFRDCYVEGNEAPAAFWLGHADGITIDTLNTDRPAVMVSNPSFNVGHIVNVQDRPGLWNVGDQLITDFLVDNLTTYSTPPAPRHGRIAFKRMGYAPPFDFIGWVCIGAEWFPFGKVEV